MDEMFAPVERVDTALDDEGANETSVVTADELVGTHVADEDAVVLPDFSEVALEGTDEAVRHEHEAVDRVEEAAAERAEAIGDPAPETVPASDDVLPDDYVEHEYVEHRPDDFGEALSSMTALMPPG